MKDELIKRVFKEMKRGLSKTGECPDESALARFAEGIVDEKEAEGIEEHLVFCSKCCDYVVSLNKVINFSAEERLPEVSDEQIRKLNALVKDREKSIHAKSILDNLARITQSVKELFTFDWMAQPIPIAVKSGALALLVILIVSTTFLYYHTPPLGVQMEVIGKHSVISTRGIPEEEGVKKVIKEGDTLYSSDYCQISFELDRDAYAYVLLYDSGGRLHQLYPDPAIEIAQKVKGGTKYSIPAEEDNWFQLDDHIGRETVFVLANNEPISGFKETFDALQGSSKEAVLKAFKSEAAVVKVLSFKHQ